MTRYMCVLLLVCACGYDRPRIAIIGDSTVASQSDGSELQGWGYYFVRAVPESKNFAKSGRSSKSFYEEGLFTQVLDWKPNIVIIQFGLNDSKPDHRYTNPQTTFKDMLRLYVRQAASVGAKVIIVGSPDRLYGESVYPYVKAAREVSIELNTQFIDLYSAQEKMRRSGDIRRLYVDYIHTNKIGAKVFSDIVSNNGTIVLNKLNNYTQ